MSAAPRNRDADNVVDLTTRRMRRLHLAVTDSVPFAVMPGGQDGAVTLAVEGELDLASSPVLEGALAATLGERDGLREVELDLGHLSFVDVAGVRALCRCAELAETHGAHFAVRGVRPHVVRVLELCGKLDLLGPA